MQLDKTTYLPFVLYMVQRVLIPEGILPRYRDGSHASRAQFHRQMHSRYRYV
jgi:hypothetical protein